MAKILFLETEYGRYRELWYASCVAKKIAAKCRELGHDVIEISKPLPSDANRVIEKEKPAVCWWTGHGNETTTTLENVKVWISTTFNTEILNDVGACALSCLTGRQLGKFLTTEKKCPAYLGYSNLFWFMWCGDPKYYNCACMGKNTWGVREELWRKIVECMHESNLYYVLGLAEGKNAGEADEYSKTRFAYWIEYLEDIDPENATEAAVIKTVIWVLNNDKNVQVLHGDPNWKITPPVLIPIEFFVTATVLLGGMMIGGMLGYSEEIGGMLKLKT